MYLEFDNIKKLNSTYSSYVYDIKMAPIDLCRKIYSLPNCTVNSGVVEFSRNEDEPVRMKVINSLEEIEQLVEDMKIHSVTLQGKFSDMSLSVTVFFDLAKLHVIAKDDKVPNSLVDAINADS